jgi:hypothetical protein
MRRNLWGLIPLFLLLSPFNDNHVRASAQAGCSTILVPIREFDKDEFVFVSLTTEPGYPIVIGQDPEKRGVDIAVAIQSRNMKMLYTHEVRIIGECLPYYSPRTGEDYEVCGQGYFAGIFYYRHLDRICRTDTVDVKRRIDVESLQVWLEPDEKTTKWLGRNITVAGEMNLLRSLYPEDWSFGTWVPGTAGFQFNEGEGYQFTVPAIERYGAEHPGFNFLKANPAYDVYHSYTLPLVNDKNTSGKDVLGLYGSFTAGSSSSQPGYGNILRWNGGCRFAQSDDPNGPKLFCRIGFPGMSPASI